jgi:hypothetical protein
MARRPSRDTGATRRVGAFQFGTANPHATGPLIPAQQRVGKYLIGGSAPRRAGTTMITYRDSKGRIRRGKPSTVRRYRRKK